jgi:hypothetical protein
MDRAARGCTLITLRVISLPSKEKEKTCSTCLESTDVGRR